MAWLSGYTYRKLKPVNATAAGAQTLYQVELLVGESSGAVGEEIDCESHCLDFPNDIRFTDTDGITKHDYWVKSITGITPNRLATVWIEVATIPVAGSINLYMYYNKAADAGESSGVDTFIEYGVTGIDAFWHMDEALWGGIPGEVKDETGGHDGEAVNGPVTIADGKRNRAGSFYGTGECVEAVNNLGVRSAFSIETWVKLATVASAKHIISGINNFYLATHDFGSGIKIYAQKLGGVNEYAVGTTTPNADQWYHVVGVYNGATIKIYIDAVEEKSEPAVGNTVGNGQIYLASFTGGANSIHGVMDETRIYDRELLQAEITALKNNYMEKMGTYYNVRKWASPEPTWGASGPEEGGGGSTIPVLMFYFNLMRE